MSVRLKAKETVHEDCSLVDNFPPWGYGLTAQILIYMCTCILELNNLVNGWQMVEASVSLLE